MTFGIYRQFIVEVIKAIGARSYLEIGVCEGILIEMVQGLGIRTVGVDIVDNLKAYGGEFHRMSSADYLQQCPDSFDVIFIDGSHKIKVVLADVAGAMAHLNPNGIILVHDTDPARSELINENGDWCGDAVRINEAEFQGWNVVTLPVGDEGLSFIRRKGETRT